MVTTAMIISNEQYPSDDDSCDDSSSIRLRLTHNTIRVLSENNGTSPPGVVACWTYEYRRMTSSATTFFTTVSEADKPLLKSHRKSENSPVTKARHEPGILSGSWFLQFVLVWFMVVILPASFRSIGCCCCSCCCS
jgi:hypothetical protein